jgi:hypothetical protein
VLDSPPICSRRSKSIACLAASIRPLRGRSGRGLLEQRVSLGAERASTEPVENFASGGERAARVRPSERESAAAETEQRLAALGRVSAVLRDQEFAEPVALSST